MKGYKRFILALTTLMAIYIIAEMNRPGNIDWKVTLSAKDKNPFGGYILFSQLKDLFPRATISSHRAPVYNQVNNFSGSNTSYILISPQVLMTPEDVKELLTYAALGNYVFISSANFSKAFTDTLKFEASRRFDLVNGDSVTVNFKNPALRSNTNYGFKRMTLDGYFKKFDTANAVVLGTNQLNDVNFIRMPYGDGAFFIHALPLSFSNYFMVTRDNAAYAAKALSYIPEKTAKIFWDEYYKLGPEGTRNPLRFILNDTWLKWAFRIGLIAMLMFILFEMKRKQRVIPVIPPLTNTTLDFVQTVGNVYFNQRDNRNIALKKITYFLEFVRASFFLSTGNLNEEFVQALSKKSSVPEEEIADLVNVFNRVNADASVSDDTLLELNTKIDLFYNRVQ